jgi:hypothetical protein
MQVINQNLFIMKKIFLILFSIILLSSCGSQKKITEKHSKHIELMDNEEILLAARASYAAKIFAQPGRLFLTNQRVYFRTSKLASKKFEFSFQFNDISEVKKSGFNFTLGAVASVKAFKIILKDDTKKVFSINKKKSWITGINKFIQ